MSLRSLGEVALVVFGALAVTSSSALADEFSVGTSTTTVQHAPPAPPAPRPNHPEISVPAVRG